MKALLVALVLMLFWVIVHKSEEILQNKRGSNISKEETLNKSKRLTVQDSFSSQVEEEVEKKDKGRQFYQRCLKILKLSKNKEDTDKAHQFLARAAEMRNQQAMEQLASDMLFGNNGPQNIEAAVSLYEILAEEGSHKGQTALGFLSSYGIGVEYSQSKALVYYTFASNGGNLLSQMILGYRYWLGINVPRSCETALIYYKKVADYIASKLEENEDMPVEKVKLMERSENLGFDTEILDWDVHQYYKFLAERGDTQIQVYLGQLHLVGRKGLERDHAKAFYYFLKAANAGNAHGMAFLGKHPENLFWRAYKTNWNSSRCDTEDWRGKGDQGKKTLSFPSANGSHHWIESPSMNRRSLSICKWKIHSIAGCKLWSSLPAEVCLIPSFHSFWRLLKMHLFVLAFDT